MTIMDMINEELMGYAPTHNKPLPMERPLYTPTPMDIAQARPMSYYIALEQDKQQANPHGEQAIMTVR